MDNLLTYITCISSELYLTVSDAYISLILISSEQKLTESHQLVRCPEHNSCIIIKYSVLTIWCFSLLFLLCFYECGSVCEFVVSSIAKLSQIAMYAQVRLRCLGKWAESSLCKVIVKFDTNYEVDIKTNFRFSVVFLCGLSQHFPKGPNLWWNFCLVFHLALSLFILIELPSHSQVQVMLLARAYFIMILFVNFPS